MASTRDLIIKFLADTKDLEKAVSKAEGTMGKLKAAAVAVGGAYAATKVVNFLGDATQAAEEDRKSQALLATQIKDTTNATDKQIAGVEKFINKLERQTGIMDDDLRPAFAGLVRATGDTGKAQTELATAMDIAAGRGVDLQSVVTALEKAHNGQTTALGRMGIATKDAAGNVLTLDQIMANAAKTYAGAAEAAITPSERWKVATQELKESIGDKLLPVIAKFEEMGASLLAWFDNLDPKWQTAIEAAGALVVVGLALAAAFTVLSAAAGAFAVVLALVTSPITLIVVGIAALAAGLIYAYTHFQTFHDTVNAVVTGVQAAITGFVDTSKKIWQDWGGAIEGVWNALAGQVKTQINIILAVVQPIIDLLHGDWGKAWDDFSARIGGAWDGVVQSIGGAVAIIENLVSEMAKAVGDAVEKIVKFFLSIPGKIAGLGEDILKQLTGGAAGLVGKVISHIPGFAEGGTVEHTGLALVHAGETITPAKGSSGGSGGVNIYGAVTVIANDPASLVRQLQQYDRQNGGVPITTRVSA